MCSNTYGVFMGKKTTTLTLDEETVEKAKKLNINISELTETVLKGFTFEPTDLEEKIVTEKYKELFAAISKILEQQGASVAVGLLFGNTTRTNPDGSNSTNYECLGDVDLTPKGELYSSDFEAELSIESENIAFLPPKQILSNLIRAIDERKERRKEEIKEIEMVKRIVEALYPTFAKK